MSCCVVYHLCLRIFHMIGRWLMPWHLTTIEREITCAEHQNSGKLCLHSILVDTHLMQSRSTVWRDQFVLPIHTDQNFIVWPTGQIVPNSLQNLWRGTVFQERLMIIWLSDNLYHFCSMTILYMLIRPWVLCPYNRHTEYQNISLISSHPHVLIVSCYSTHVTSRICIYLINHVLPGNHACYNIYHKFSCLLTVLIQQKPEITSFSGPV